MCWSLAHVQLLHRGPRQTQPTALGPTGPWRWADAAGRAPSCFSLPVSAHTWDGAPLIGSAPVTYCGGASTEEKLVSGKAGGCVDPEAHCLKLPGQAASCLDPA